MFYYTYITRLQHSDKYYVGRHQSKKNPKMDKYFGSGKWVRSIKDRTQLYREILCFYSNEFLLLDAEKALIAEHIKNENCMNVNENAVGFSSYNNPSKTTEARARNRNRMLASNHMRGGTHSDAAKELIRESSTGRIPSLATRKKHSNSMIGKNLGKVWSIAQREQLSNTRKTEYMLGTRIHARGMAGKSHTEDSLAKMRNNAYTRERIICEHCNKKLTKQNYVRWHGDKCKVITMPS